MRFTKHLLCAAIAAGLSSTALANAKDEAQTTISDGWTLSELSRDAGSAATIITARSAQGPALAFACGEDIGLYSVLVYEPEEELVPQVTRKQSMSHKHYGTVTVAGHEPLGHTWRWKAQNGTIEVRDTEVGITLLNAIFSGDEVALSFRSLDDYALTLPAADGAMKEFIAGCPKTAAKPAS
tara:strand:- start:6366 stop:6911 length:546 start_codon:yes stop_codon:yes gene_type:complete